MSNADGYVLPKPGVPKTLGILNVIFGVLVVLVVSAWSDSWSPGPR